MAPVSYTHLYITPTVGLPTLNDILAELEKPGRDPRQPIQEFRFSDSVHTIDRCV